METIHSGGDRDHHRALSLRHVILSALPERASGGGGERKRPAY
jgi:hypothetical protein